MAGFAAEARDGRWQAVVNIGIGGSDLGPAMATAALDAYADADLDVRFLSNVDGAHFGTVTRGLDPARTLFIVVSKTFTTTETLANAITAPRLDRSRRWRRSSQRPLRGSHRPPRQGPGLWHRRWCRLCHVGLGGWPLLPGLSGRISLIVAVGADAFVDLLAGMHHIDEHFRHRAVDQEPAGLAGAHRHLEPQLLGMADLRSAPLRPRTGPVPGYIQQLDMESSGKSVRADGTPVGTATGPVVWGQPGTQRSTRLPPVAAPGHRHRPGRVHRVLPAQPWASRTPRPANGQPVSPRPRLWPSAPPKSATPIAAFPATGPAPSSLATSSLPARWANWWPSTSTRCSPRPPCGDINPFDQWGVELGKSLATGIAAELAGAATPRTPPATPPPNHSSTAT